MYTPITKPEVSSGTSPLENPTYFSVSRPRSESKPQAEFRRTLFELSLNGTMDTFRARWWPAKPGTE